ncbi:MAG: helix-turn-helix transcriptional regulator [Ruminococcus sp.]|nr:helix-turn-helix transcriptional regulator [Ruminococcus sp.]
MYETSRILKKLRIEKGLSLKQLEKLTGISSSSLQRYESGDSPSIPVDKLITLSDALNVTLDVLLGISSPDVPSSLYYAYSKIIERLNYDIHYESDIDKYVILIPHDDTEYFLAPQDIKELLEDTTSYLDYGICKLIKNQICQ